LSDSKQDVDAAYSAFGDSPDAYQELSEGEYVLSLLQKWPALAQMNGLTISSIVTPGEENNKMTKSNS
jgi:hypothetical protein